MRNTVFWAVGLTLPSSARDEIKALAGQEGRADANMVRALVREALDARRRKEESDVAHAG